MEQQIFLGGRPASDDEIRFMREALLLARHAAARGNDPYGAVLVRDGAIVARGENRVRTMSDPTCHAELGMIRDYCTEQNTLDLSDCTLYASCEPCFMCSACITRVRLGKLVFSAYEADCAAIEGSEKSDRCQLIFQNAPYAPEVVEGFLREEGIEVLKTYLK